MTAVKKHRYSSSTHTNKYCFKYITKTNPTTEIFSRARVHVTNVYCLFYSLTVSLRFLGWLL